MILDLNRGIFDLSGVAIEWGIRMSSKRLSNEKREESLEGGNTSWRERDKVESKCPMQGCNGCYHHISSCIRHLTSVHKLSKKRAEAMMAGEEQAEVGEGERELGEGQGGTGEGQGATGEGQGGVVEGQGDDGQQLEKEGERGMESGDQAEVGAGLGIHFLT